jgi:hypothetical protein
VSFQLRKPSKPTIAAVIDAVPQAFAEYRGLLESRNPQPERQQYLSDRPADEFATAYVSNAYSRGRGQAGRAVDRYVWDTLGMAGYARMLLGRLTIADLHKLAPEARVPDANAKSIAFTQANRIGADQTAADDAREWMRKWTHGTGRAEAEQRTAREGREALLVSEPVDGIEVFPVAPRPEVLASVRDFAERLAAREVIKRQHDDQGSTILSAALPMWTAGAYLTPLADVTPAPAKLAVSLLVDVSGSTDAILGPLWASACALRAALIEAGHACALDVWSYDLVCRDQPLRGWSSAADYIQPCKVEGGTVLANSAEPAMGRLQATAPHGMRQVCMVITDGGTHPEDRAEFLAKASVPCLYWAVTRYEGEALILPQPHEGWASIVKCTAKGLLEQLLGEQTLEQLLAA